MAESEFAKNRAADCLTGVFMLPASLSAGPCRCAVMPGHPRLLLSVVRMWIDTVLGGVLDQEAVRILPRSLLAV